MRPPDTLPYSDLSRGNSTPPTSSLIGRAIAPNPHSRFGSLKDSPLNGRLVITATKRNNVNDDGGGGARHSRSYSNPFSSVSSKSQWSKNGLDTNEDGMLVGRSSNYLEYPVPRWRDKPTSPRQRSLDEEITKGRCATCGTLVRWPKSLVVFRCTVCFMVNDLEASLETRKYSLVRSEKTQSSNRPYSAAASCGTAPVSQITVERTSAIIDDCLNNFLLHEKHTLVQSTPCHCACGIGSTSGHTATVHSSVNTIDYHSSLHASADTPNDVSPTHSRKQTPSIIGDIQCASSPANVFRHLEGYINACFSNVDTLNSSFRPVRPGPPVRAVSDSKVVEHALSSTLAEGSINDIVFPDLDAKTLLAGDFAENGAWWTGKPNSKETSTSRISTEAQNKVNSHTEVVTSRHPNIDWAMVHEWYELISSLQRVSSERMQDLRNQRTVASAQGHCIATREQRIRSLYSQLEESCGSVHRTLVKATENLLRRPGRPLKRPHECRFLLIILANPMLTLHKAHDAANSPLLWKHRQGYSYNQGSSSSPPTESQCSHKEAPPWYKHSGVIKRTLGLLANLPHESHQCLINWISRYSEAQLTGLVELIDAFVSHRLVRLSSKERSHNGDTSAGGWIPSIPGGEVAASADLHATIGAPQGNKSGYGGTSALLYGNDWQVKVAAKVMLLLFSANNNDPVKWYDIATRPYEHGSHRASSGLSRRLHRHGQLLPTRLFYNGLLDYQDLVADFDMWESRREQFCFCQYPMFLSIWAKIRIMEHDARRQMESKARQAFFDSIIRRKAVNQYLTLKVRRQCLVEDSFRGVSEVVGAGQEEIKKGLRIEFVGEEGLDSGGLRKEWFLLLVREVFDPNHGLFVYDDDSRHCYFNPNSFETSDQFFLIGALLGLAIYNSTILDVALPPFAFRKLLASAPVHNGPRTHSSRPVGSCSLDDLAEFRPVLARGLRQLLEYEGDVEHTFLLDFVAVVERYGKPQQVALCPHGEHRSVTNANRREYVDLYVRYLLEAAVTRQFEPFKRGFFTICAGNALSLFRAEEIELLIRGSDEHLDVAALQAVAIHENWGPMADPLEEPVIQWFWDAFRHADAKKQRRLLSFITGSDRIPAMGAASLVIKVACLGWGNERFPIARTCFNLLGLYRYRSRALLEERLWRAIMEGEGFGMK